MNKTPAARPSSGPQARDQNESAFSAILADLVRRIPGARAAALVDPEGETVDYAGCKNPYELKVAAATFRIVLDEARGQPSLQEARCIVVRASRASFVVQWLPEAYALVIWLARGAGFRGLVRAVPASIGRLAREAGWSSFWSPWHAVDVLLDARRAPRAVRAAGRELGHETPIEVLGRFRTALPEHERAWRVRLPTNIEFTLVRESGDFWYMDAALVDRAD